MRATTPEASNISLIPALLEGDACAKNRFASTLLGAGILWIDDKPRTTRIVGLRFGIESILTK
jgi:hypothetical protein